MTDPYPNSEQEAAIDRVVLRALEQAGLCRWVKNIHLVGCVQRHLGIASSAVDVHHSARRIWEQLNKQEATKMVEYDAKWNRYRLVKRGKLTPKKEGAKLWNE